MAENFPTVGQIVLVPKGGSGRALSAGIRSLTGPMGIGTSAPLAALAINGGLHVGGDSDPGDNNLEVDGTLLVTGLTKTAGGVHVGGTSDPGADNLTVDGVILTDSLTNTQIRNSMASAYLSADQNVTDAGWSKINMAHENFDIGGNYDVSNYRYVAPVTGYYQVSWSVGFNYSTHIKIAIAGIYVNGALVGQGGQYQVAGTAYLPYILLSGSRLLYVVSGQYIELYGYCDVDSGTPTVDGDSYNSTCMTVHLVST